MTGIEKVMSKFIQIWLGGFDRRMLALLCGRGGEPGEFTKDEVGWTMRRRVMPRFWLFMIAATLIVFFASFAVMRLRYAQGVQRLARALATRDEMALQVNALSDKLDFAQTDDYVIRMARDELGMIMPGEVRYVNNAR